MSAKLRLTLWVTCMVLLLSVLVLVYVLVMNRHSLTESPAEYMVDMVLDNAKEVEYDNGRFEWDDLDVYKRGVFCSFYDENGREMLSANQEDMDFSDIHFKQNELRTVTVSGVDYYLYDKLVDMEVGSIWVRGVVPVTSSDGVMAVIVKVTAFVLPAILLLTFIGSWFISKHTFKPVEQIVQAANSISDADDLTARIDLKRGPTEMKQIAGSFDRMFDRLEKAFESERQFTSDASHELRTPTTVILAECERSHAKGRKLADYRASIDVIEEQGRRMSDLIEELLGLTRLEQGTDRYPLKKADFSTFVEASADEFVPEDDRGIKFETDIEQGVMCKFNAGLMSRVIFNLLQNAYKYGRNDGNIKLSLSRDEEGHAVLSIADDGIGIAPENQDKIWQRFWQADTSRSEGGGSGLGLAMVKEIVEFHGGTIAVDSEPGRGSTFTVII